jgi:hypothetical protein
MEGTFSFRFCKITVRVMKIALSQFYPEGQEIENTPPLRKEVPLLRLIYSPEMTYDGAFE